MSQLSGRLSLFSVFLILPKHTDDNKEIAEYGEDDDGEDHDALENVTDNIIFRNLDRRRR